MAISKQDRNVGITVAIVLVVCIASLIAIGSTFIRLITPGVERIAELLGAGVRVSTVDYNFNVGAAPQTQVPIPPQSSTTSSSPNTLGPNVPANPTNPENLEIRPPQVRELSQPQRQAIGKSANFLQLLNLAAAPKNLEVLGHIYIPKLGLYSPILSGGDFSESLFAGFALHPNSLKPNLGEWGIICQRSYFAAFDQRSCLFLDELNAEDQILFVVANTVYTYEVAFTLNQEKSSLSANYSPIGDTLRIITTDLENQNIQYLVAIPVTN